MPSTLSLLLAAAPDAPGAADVVARARRRLRDGTPVRVLLTGDGLAWRDRDELAAMATAGADLALCSRSTREQGLAPDTLPPVLRWSSLVAWFGDEPDDGDLWTVLP